MNSFEQVEAISAVFTAFYYLASAAVVIWVGLEFRAGKTPKRKPEPAMTPMTNKVIHADFRPCRAA